MAVGIDGPLGLLSCHSLVADRPPPLADPKPAASHGDDDKTVASAEMADSDSDWHDVKPDLCSMGAEVRLDVDSDKRDMETDDNGADSSDNLLPQVNARFTAVR